MSGHVHFIAPSLPALNKLKNLSRRNPRFFTAQRPVQQLGGVFRPQGLESAASDRAKEALSYRIDYRSSFESDPCC